MMQSFDKSMKTTSMTTCSENRQETDIDESQVLEDEINRITGNEFDEKK